MQILTSVQTGRRFMTAFIPAEKRFLSFRLDLMHLPRSGAVFDGYDGLCQRYAEISAKSFGVSLREVPNAEPLEVVINADEINERYVIDRLKREKRSGDLQKTDENEFTLTLDICDPTEAMKWVKTFIGRIKRINGGTENVRRQFKEDIDRMYEMYGGDDDEDIQ